METYFALAGRTDEKDLAAEIDIASRNPVMSGLLHAISGLLAVLDEHRQIIAVNDAFLKMLGIDDPAKVLGLRPGEAVQCVHAQEEPAGCGTTKFCSTCGAAIAIVASMAQDAAVEKMCALSVLRGGTEVNMALLVRSHPVRIADKRFLLLFLQDITQQEHSAALERIFFHDVNNMLAMLVGASELLVLESPSELAAHINNTALRLYKEVAIQRCLSKSETREYQAKVDKVPAGKIREDLQAFFASHPAAHKKKIEFQKNCPAVALTTDISLLSRVLCNMVINALEASEENGVVKIWIEQEGSLVTFCVWNAQEIPQEIVHRIFQRNFSTKGQAGRGIGTFSMKLFGEKILGGQVSFTTSREGGTVFRFSLAV